MYAVIATGGKQYKVTEDEPVRIEKLTAAIGSKVEFDHILMIANSEGVKVGNPYLENTKVIGEVIREERGEKISIIKFRRRKHFMKRAGHRQDYTMIRIIAIDKK